jgi:hypothetical protein
MKLKTTVDVTCPIQGKVEGYTGKLIGELLTVVMYPSVVASWQYKKEDGTPILTGEPIRLTSEQADALLLGNPITSMEVSEQVFYGAMRVEMASAFEITTNQIETINE